MSAHYPMDWCYAFGEPDVSGLFRCTPEDFQVDEDLGMELSGRGEHVYLHIKKCGDNTAWVAKQVAQLAGVESNDVGYAGLKDRHAVTTQWFSVYLPKGEEPDWQQLNGESITVLAVQRHQQKLRRGDHKRNHFCIRLHQLEGALGGLTERLNTVAERGVPNYFGEQRFGRQGNNLNEAQRLLVDGVRIKNRQQRGMILSAARSYLFNQVLSARIEQSVWSQEVAGDVMIGSMPTGPLWGRGRLASTEACLRLEQNVLEPLQAWCDGLEHVGLSQERRLLGLRPQDFSFRLEGSTLELSFYLPPGTYATAVLREICKLKTVPVQTDVV